MLPAILAQVMLAGSTLLMLGSIAQNQINPSYATALAVPIANAAGLILALLATAVAVAAHRRDRKCRGAKCTVVFAILSAITLTLLLPLADLGFLSRVR